MILTYYHLVEQKPQSAWLKIHSLKDLRACFRKMDEDRLARYKIETIRIDMSAVRTKHYWEK